jgi:hypothetical protein
MNGVVSKHFQTQLTLKHALDAIKKIGKFIPSRQLEFIGDLCRGEEKQFFFDKLCELEELICGMPQTYGQDGKGDDAIVYLHYFAGGAMNWWITEKDSEPAQNQAFGLADLGYGGELGYISIMELCESKVELDLHWKPTRLGDIRKG